MYLFIPLVHLSLYGNRESKENLQTYFSTRNFQLLQFFKEDFLLLMSKEHTHTVTSKEYGDKI